MSSAAAGIFTPYTASAALAAAAWCASGHTPQMRGVISGISSIGRPSRNFSNPRSSGMTRYADSTEPASSRNMSMRPCPSSRVMGSMLIAPHRPASPESRASGVAARPRPITETGSVKQ